MQCLKRKNGLSGRLDAAEESISELVNRAIEINQTEAQREKDVQNMGQSLN